MAEQDVGGLLARLRLDAEGFFSAIEKAKESAEGLGIAVSDVGKQFTKAAGMTAAYGATMGVATGQAGNFEQAMANVGAVIGASGEELKILGDIAIEAGQTTSFSIMQSAEAMLALGKAGARTAGDFRNSLIPTLQLASAAHAEIGATVEVVDATLRAFGLDVSETTRLTNVFATAAGTTSVSLDELSGALSSAAPASATIGQSLEDVTAILVTLSEMGVRGARAGMTLRQVMLNLAAPTKDVAEALKRHGISLDELASLLPKPIELLKRLHDANLSNADAAKIFGDRGIALFKVVKDGLPDLAAMRERLSGTDSASRMASQQLDTFNGSMKKLKGSLESVVIAFGTGLLPIVRQWVDDIKESAVSMSRWIVDHQALIQVMVVEVGKLLLLVTAITGAAKAWVMLSSTMAIIRNITGLTAVAIQVMTNNLLMASGAAAVAGRAMQLMTAVAPWLALAAAIAYVGDKVLDWKEKQIAARDQSNASAASNKGLAESLTRVATELDKVRGKTDEVTLANKILEQNGMRPNISSHDDLIRRIKGLNAAAAERLRQDSVSASQSEKNSQRRADAAKLEMEAYLSAAKEKETAQSNFNVTEVEAIALAQGYTQQELIEYEKRKAALLLLVQGGKLSWSDYYTWIATEGQKFHDSEALRMQALQELTTSILQGTESAWSNSIAGMLAGTATFTQGVQAMWEGLKSSVIKAISDMMAKWLVFTVMKGALRFLTGGLLGFSEGGMIGAQNGLLPAGEDMLIGVQQGEAVLTQRGVAAVGGPGGVAAINSGTTGSGDTFVFNIKTLTGQVDEASIDYITKAVQMAKRRYSGAMA